jgi:hypothetical protein
MNFFFLSDNEIWKHMYVAVKVKCVIWQKQQTW